MNIHIYIYIYIYIVLLIAHTVGEVAEGVYARDAATRLSCKD